jgi:WhiB family redox-sensing transcriptional regulator
MRSDVLLGERPDWHKFAACKGADPNLFFPERFVVSPVAHTYCRRCPVQQDCLSFAIEANENWGIWGGMSQKARRAEARRRRIAKATRDLA